MAVTKYRTKP